MHHLLKLSLNYLFPQTCILCSERSLDQTLLCTDCHLSLPWQHNACIHCASTLSPSNSVQICGKCLKNRPVIQRTHTLFQYQMPIDTLINQLKFSGKLAVASSFGHLWLEHLTNKHIDLPTVFIPVPLHKTRLKERSFNQALEIVRPISTYLKIPALTKGIIRQKQTQAQATLSIKKRAKNTRHAFLIETDLSNQHVVIIDDVITTGQTALSLAQALIKAGATRVDAWCCARA